MLIDSSENIFRQRKNPGTLCSTVRGDKHRRLGRRITEISNVEQIRLLAYNKVII
jgi:hypothetical protein